MSVHPLARLGLSHYLSAAVCGHQERLDLRTAFDFAGIPGASYQLGLLQIKYYFPRIPISNDWLKCG